MEKNYTEVSVREAAEEGIIRFFVENISAMEAKRAQEIILCVMRDYGKEKPSVIEQMAMFNAVARVKICLDV